MPMLFPRLRNLILASFFISVSFFALVPISFAQGVDLEPNNSCPEAQDFGLVSLPFSVSGSLDPYENEPDVDFFRFTGTPGDLVQADLHGNATGAGTLGDPLLGLFNNDCNLIEANDDSGYATDSRLMFLVPENGEYKLAATAFPDYSFFGSGEGSYLLTISTPPMIDSVRGRFVDASNGNIPISGENPTYAAAQLYRCNDEYCSEFIGSQQLDLDGNFNFGIDFYGPVLLAGNFQIQAWANGYEYYTSETFEVLENQALDLGDIAMTPLKFIGQISGRLVDDLDRSPLVGYGPPWASAALEKCDEDGYGCASLITQQADELGNFTLDGFIYQFQPGTYRVTATAEGYQQTSTLPFELAESESIDLGDIGVVPEQIQYGDVTACETIQVGGTCEFGFEMRNRGPGRFKGQVWGLVEFYTSVLPFYSRFQIGKLGVANPMPEKINLKEGQAISMQFKLNIPKDVQENSAICVFATVGSDPGPQFHSLGQRLLFCGSTQTGQFKLMSEKESRRHLQKIKGQK